MQHIEIIPLENCGDRRGALYNILDRDLKFLDKLKNIHFGRIRPGSIRGNHFHRQTKEILIISYSDRWTLAWTKKDSAEMFKRDFTGSGAVLIKIKEGIAHSVKNNGPNDLEIIALSNRIFTLEDSDTISKTLL